jgi:hypothetical protein
MLDPPLVVMEDKESKGSTLMATAVEEAEAAQPLQTVETLDIAAAVVVEQENLSLQ